MKVEIVELGKERYAIRRTKKFLWWTHYEYKSLCSHHWLSIEHAAEFCTTPYLDALREFHFNYDSFGRPIEEVREG